MRADAMSSDFEQFNKARADAVAALRANAGIRSRSEALFAEMVDERYQYNFDWMGLPVIQFPQDLVAAQELIWRIKPAAIVETGVAHGGSIVFYASMLALLGGDGIVVGVDIDIRAHNRAAIEDHPMAERIRLVEGSSIDDATIDAVRAHVGERRPVMVVLDSNHTHEHVLGELRRYGALVGEGSYIVVYDSVIDRLPADHVPGRPWGPGNNPRTAIHAFLAENDRFEIDSDMEAKLLLTCCLDGFLRCTRDP